MGLQPACVRGKATPKPGRCSHHAPTQLSREHEGLRERAKASDLFKSGQSVIDSVADKGLFHKNKAARHKSRLSAKIKALGLGA